MMKKWYALKVFYNRFSEIKATLSRETGLRVISR